jgi:hypothetical protein
MPGELRTFVSMPFTVNLPGIQSNIDPPQKCGAYTRRARNAMRGSFFTLTAVALTVLGTAAMTSADEPQVTSQASTLDIDQVFDSPATQPRVTSLAEVEVPQVEPTRLVYENAEQIFADAGVASGHSACDSCGDACGCGSLCGCGQPFMSDHAFDGFIEPISNPIWFMDPRSRTRARFVFVNHEIPASSILGRGDLQIYALQVSVAINERLSFIANKDGYNTLQAAGLPSSASGHGDIATGLQYVFIRDTCNQFIVSGGLIAEWSQGSSSVFQGNDDGTWNSYLTAGKELDEKTHAIATVGWHLPANGNKESESVWSSFHLDRQIGCTGLAAV